MISPSQFFVKYLTKSGFTTLPEECKGRTKWHFSYLERDGFTHYGFVEKQDNPLTGVIEVDKRYRPTQGFPMNDGLYLNTYLHVVMDSDMRRAAIMTPWSFMCLDSSMPDRWDENKGSMVFRVPATSYHVVDLNIPRSDQLVYMEEIDA